MKGMEKGGIKKMDKEVGLKLRESRPSDKEGKR